MKIRTRLLPLLIFCCFCLNLSGANDVGVVAAKPSRVLFLSSFRSSHPMIREVVEQLNRKFVERRNPVVIDYVFLNTLLPGEHDVQGRFRQLLPALRRGDYDVTIAMQKDAIALVNGEYESLPKSMPILYSVYRDMPSDFRDAHPNITGFEGRLQPEAVFDLILRLRPDTRAFLVVTDNSDLGGELHDRMAVLKNYRGVQVLTCDGRLYNTPRMLKCVAERGENVEVVLAPWRQYLADGYASMDDFAADFSDASRRTYFTLTSSMMGKGAAAGVVADSERLGEEIAALLAELLNGRDVRNVPFAPVPSGYAADISVMLAANLDVRRLPPGTQKINEPPNFFSAYPLEFRLFAGVFAGLLLLLIIAGFYVRLLLRVRRNMREYGDSFQMAFNSVGDGLLMVNSRQKIVAANPVATGMIGIAGMELRGGAAERIFVISGGAESFLKQAFETGRRTDFPENCELTCADGRVRRISGCVSPLWSRGGEVTGAVIVFRDITEDLKRDQAQEQALKAFAAATELAGIGCFLSDFTGVDLLHSGRLNRLVWENGADGKALPPEQWIHPEDLKRFLSEWNSLKTGEKDQIRFQYRSLRNGSVGYYRLFASLLDSGADAPRKCVCAIQNISEVGENERKLNDANKLFRTVIDSLPCMLTVKDVDDDCRFLIANAAFRRTLKKQENEIVGKSDFEVFDTETAKKIRRSDRTIAGTPESEVSTYLEEMPTPRGVLCLKTSKTPFLTSDGRTFLLSAALDVTELSNARTASEEARLLLRTIFDSVPVGLFLKDPDNGFQYRLWNRRLEDYTGCSAAAAVGKTDAELKLHPELLAHFQEQDAEVMRLGSSLHSEEERSRNGVTSYYHMEKKPITLPSGKRYLLGSFIDFSERLHLEKSLQQTILRQHLLLTNEQIYNDCMRDIASDDDFSRVVKRVLGVIGRKCAAARCFVLCATPPQNFTDRNFEWTDDGITPHLELIGKFSPAELKRLSETLGDRKSCRIERGGEHPELFRVVETFCGKSFDAQSMLVTAMEYRGKFWGVLGITRVRNRTPFSQEEEDMLCNCASLFLLAKEHAQQELRLDAAMHMRKMILGNIRIPIFLFDAEARLVSVNPAGCRIVGKSESEILSEPCHRSYCKKIPGVENCPVRCCIAEKRTAHGELMIGGKEFSITADPIFDASGKLMYVIENAMDMTEINSARRRLESAFETAQAADRAKSNFIATMNHEIRTPLNSILGFAELLSMGGESPGESREYLRSLKQAGQRLLAMVNDVLVLARMESAGSSVSLGKTDAGALLSGVAEDFASDIRQKKLHFTLKAEDGISGLWLDSVGVRRILFALFDNAVKFTESGGIEVRAAFERGPEHLGTLRISVRDTGIGIAPEMLEKIFEPFIQDDGVRSSRAYQGSGLGLAIGRKLALGMGGGITVESTPGKGSTFTLKIERVRYE